MMFPASSLRRSLLAISAWLVACPTCACLGITVNLDYQHDTFFTSHPTAKAAIDAVTQKAGNKATPVERIKAAKGFKVELLYSLPSDTHGS